VIFVNVSGILVPLATHVACPVVSGCVEGETALSVDLFLQVIWVS